MYTNEPPLHKAVLNDDIQYIKKNHFSKSELHQRNDWGLTARELANYLGKNDLAHLISPSYQRYIKAFVKNTLEIKKYSPEEFRCHFGVTYLAHLHFKNYDLLKKVMLNTPWLIKKSIWGEDNRRLGVQHSWETSMGYVSDSTVKWINEDIGYGLFTNKNLSKGCYIGEYTGNIRQLHRLKPDHNVYCFHYPTRLFSWNFFMVDAATCGNELRFINHSEHPNLTPACLYDNGLLHFVFFANQDISKDVELTFNYGGDFWKK